MRFLVPLALEALAVRRGAPGSPIDRVGMGPARATAFAEAFATRSSGSEPLCLIGVAGGLAEGGRPGDVVVASSLRAAGGGGEVHLGEAEGVALLLEGAGVPVTLGAVVSAPVIVHGQAARAELSALGNLAVDMESYWCAPLAVARPFAVVRVLLDVPAAELNARRALGATGAAYRSLWRAARLLAGWSPGSVDRYPLSEIGGK